MENKYIFINKNSLSPSVCNDLITLFENSEQKKLGTTLGGYKKDIKDTIELVINQNIPTHYKYYQLLLKELHYNLKKYITLHQSSEFKTSTQHENNIFNILPNHLCIPHLQIQKYKQNQGKYNYHNDFAIKNDKMRVITFIWYLNTVIEGGETTFNGDYSINPEVGKLVLFPATWTYPHCGKMPISSDKYIITGWVYIDINAIE